MTENDPTTRRTFILAAGTAATLGRRGRPVAADEVAEEAAPPQDQVSDENETAIDERTIAAAERLAGVTFTAAERRQCLQGMDEVVDRFRRRQTIDLDMDLSPALAMRPSVPAVAKVVTPWKPLADPGPVPPREADIAFAPVTALSAWLDRGAITSARLTDIYLRRLRRYGPKLECVVTMTEDLARRQAASADTRRAAGERRGPLDGVPWGAKDLLDTKGIRTTWGATPFRDRVPERDAVVVRRLHDAGAVLVAKLTLGALAYGDIWFDGRTRNPWNLEQGSSGSSAGSAAATAAGLVGFSLGTETYGSIVSPCMRCGATGLRPTFGRVPRTGAMPLCWSMDKIGPIGRSVGDCGLILDVINGADDADPSSVDVPTGFDGPAPVTGLRVGYDPAWFDEAHALDDAVLDTLRGLGVELVPIALPEWSYDALLTILFVEAAASMEALTLTGRDDELVWQAPEAWPNTFRQTRFTPAIEYVQSDRFRRRVTAMLDERFADVDAMISPSFAADLLLITNATGHPCLVLRTGVTDEGTPHGITLWGRMFGDATLCRLGIALEASLGVATLRPRLEAARRRPPAE